MWKGTRVWRLPKSILSSTPPSLSPHGFQGWVTGLPAIIPSTTELPYSTVTRQGAHSSVILAQFPPLIMLLFFLPPLSPQLPSFCLNVRVVTLEKNISRQVASLVSRIFTGARLSTIFFTILSTKIQKQFSSCFTLKYQNAKLEQHRQTIFSDPVCLSVSHW